MADAIATRIAIEHDIADGFEGRVIGGALTKPDRAVIVTAIVLDEIAVVTLLFGFANAIATDVGIVVVSEGWPGGADEDREQVKEEPATCSIHVDRSVVQWDSVDECPVARATTCARCLWFLEK